MMTRLSLLSLIFVSSSALACIPKTYEFGAIQLTYDGKLIKSSVEYATQQIGAQRLSLSEGDSVDLNASKPRSQDANQRLSVKLVSVNRPQGDGGTTSAVYLVTETTTEGEGPNAGKPVSKRQKITVSHQEGTRGLGCGEVTAEEVQATTQAQFHSGFSADECETHAHGRHLNR